MHIIGPLIIISLIAIRVIIFFWRQTIGEQKPISNNGLSIFYPLLLYLILICFAGSQLFVNRSGALVLPPVSLTTIVAACVLGAICAIPVLLTTNYEFKQDLIYVKKSKAFLLVLLGVIALRFALRSILFSLMPATSLLFLTLLMATVYMTIWRVGSFVKFRKLWHNSIAG